MFSVDKELSPFQYILNCQKHLRNFSAGRILYTGSLGFLQHIVLYLAFLLSATDLSLSDSCSK